MVIYLQAYQKSASFVPQLATKVVSWLDVQPDDVILDIGCGGAYVLLTQPIARNLSVLLYDTCL